MGPFKNSFQYSTVIEKIKVIQNAYLSKNPLLVDPGFKTLLLLGMTSYFVGTLFFLILTEVILGANR